MGEKRRSRRWVDVGKGEDGDICDSVNNKNKEKIFFRTENRELH